MTRSSRSEDEIVIKREFYWIVCRGRIPPLARYVLSTLYICVLSLIETLKRPRVLMVKTRIRLSRSCTYSTFRDLTTKGCFYLLLLVLYIFALSKLKRGTRERTTRYSAIVTAAKSRKASLVCVSLDMRETTPTIFACTAIYINPPRNEFNDTNTTRSYKCLRNAK